MSRVWSWFDSTKGRIVTLGLFAALALGALAVASAVAISQANSARRGDFCDLLRNLRPQNKAEQPATAYGLRIVSAVDRTSHKFRCDRP